MKAFAFYNQRLFKDADLTMAAHFGEFEPDGADYELIQGFPQVPEGTLEQVCDYVFEILNLDVKPRGLEMIRSMSVGDIVVVTNPPEKDRYFLCAPLGWKLIPLEGLVKNRVG